MKIEPIKQIRNISLLIAAGIFAFSMLVLAGELLARCGSRVAPPDITGKEAPFEIKLTELNQKSTVHDSERVLIKGTISEHDGKAVRDGRPIKVYRLEADGLAVELMGKEAKQHVGKTVTVQGFMRIFGDPRKEGIKAFRLSIEKIIL